MITLYSATSRIHDPRTDKGAQHVVDVGGKARVAASESPLAFAQGNWVGFEDGFRQEKAITISEDGSLVSKNRVYDKDGKLAQEGSVVVKLLSETRGFLTFYKKDGSKAGVEGPCTISKDRIECRGDDFALNVYFEGSGAAEKKLVFAKKSQRLYGDNKFHFLKMVRA